MKRLTVVAAICLSECGATTDRNLVLQLKLHHVIYVFVASI